MEIVNHLATQLILAINIYQEIQLNDQTTLDRYITEQCLECTRSHQTAMPAGFTFSRKLYRSFHIDPTKYRPSSEALWRRLKNKADFPRVNPFVDLTNLLSIKYQICYGLYDTNKLTGLIEATIGKEANQYPGIRKEIIHLRGKMMLIDREGPFGNPSSDSYRTSTSSTSKNILQVLFFHPEDPDKMRITDETKTIFQQFFSIGDCRSYLI